MTSDAMQVDQKSKKVKANSEDESGEAISL